MKERTFEYYGETGYRRGETPQYITGLGAYKPSEATGWRTLAFKNLLLENQTPVPLYFDNKYARVAGGGFASRQSGVVFQVDILGTDITWS